MLAFSVIVLIILFYLLLSLIIDKTYFFARFIDSKRFRARQEKIDQEKGKETEEEDETDGK